MSTGPRAALALALGLGLAAAAPAGDRIAAGQLLVEALSGLRADGLELMFSSELVKPWMRVREAPTANEPLAIAGEILAAHGLRLQSGPGNRWLVVPAQGGEPPPALSLQGRVVDATTGQPIAAVQVLAAGRTGRTDQDGRFALDVPDLTWLEARAPGYQAAGVQARPGEPLLLRLRSAPRPLEELTVVASRYRLFGEHPGADLSHEEIDRLPHLADDLSRAIRRLPSAAANDFSAQFNLRGGMREETLLRLDGLELLDPFHLKDLQGALSIVDSNLVERVDLLPGGFPLRYGDHASGVVDIHTVPSPAQPEHSIGVSFVNAFANTRGSFADQRGGWLLSARRGYLDWIFSLIDTGGGEFTPRYYDLLARLEHDLGERHTASGHALFAHDDLLFIDDTEDTRSAGEADTLFLWGRLQSRWTDELESDTVYWRSDVGRIRDAVVNDPDGLDADLLDSRDIRVLGLRSDWRYQWTDRWNLAWGVELQHHEVDFDYTLTASQNNVLYPDSPPIDRRARALVDGEEYGLYGALGLAVSERLAAEFGLRWDAERYSGLGEDLASPRLTLRYRLGPGTGLWAAWGIYHQFQAPGALQVEDGLQRFFPARRAEHRMIGLEHGFSPGITARAEVYQKLYSDLPPRYTNVFDPIEIIPEAEPDRVRIDASSARSQGLELTLRRRAASGFSWWASYSIAEVEDRIGGTDVPREWDQRHATNLVGNWRGERWNFNLAGAWHSGWPKTEPTLGLVDTPAGPRPGVLPGPRNAARYGDYTRIDVRVSRDLRLVRGRFSYFFEVYNVLDTENPCCIGGLEVFPGPVLRSNVDSWLPRLPSFGFIWTFR